MSPHGTIAHGACILCGLAVPELLTWAHENHRKPRARGAKREKARFRLCWTCHRAYDLGIVWKHELVAAEKSARALKRRPSGAAIWRLWKRELEAHRRHVNRAPFRERARKAVKTREERERTHQQAGIRAGVSRKENEHRRNRRLHRIANTNQSSHRIARIGKRAAELDAAEQTRISPLPNPDT